MSFVCRKEPSVIVIAQLFALLPSVQKFAPEKPLALTKQMTTVLSGCHPRRGNSFFQYSCFMKLHCTVEHFFFFPSDFIQILTKNPKSQRKSSEGGECTEGIQSTRTWHGCLAIFLNL